MFKKETHAHIAELASLDSFRRPYGIEVISKK